jgi:flagellin
MNNAEFAIQSKQVSYENQQAARSRIMDADFAEETSRLSRFQILQQAGTAMVAQANAIPQNVLTLLR